VLSVQVILRAVAIATASVGPIDFHRTSSPTRLVTLSLPRPSYTGGPVLVLDVSDTCLFVRLWVCASVLLNGSVTSR